MADETTTAFPGGETIEAASETRLAEMLHELSGKHGALREELGRLEGWIERIEIELARRGSGG
jgi:hypothetical protein